MPAAVVPPLWDLVLPVVSPRHLPGGGDFLLDGGASDCMLMIEVALDGHFHVILSGRACRENDPSEQLHQWHLP